MGQALALKQSFLKHNADFKFYIVLVDTISEQVNYNDFAPAQILPIGSIQSIDIEDLIARYYIIELNTSVKPSVFKHLINSHPDAESIYYLDPDLFFYHSLEHCNTILKTHTAVLTPHINSPIPRDGKQPDENTFFRFGIYNLGFIGINPQTNEALKMLNWWEERTLKFGYDRPNKGYFVDQLWMTLAPLLFRGIVIETSFGYNMAPWNLHERHIVEKNGEVFQLNDQSVLVFYHFSKIAEDDEAISREYDRFILNDFPLLKELYLDYKCILKQTGFWEYKKIPIAYPVKMSLKKETKKESFLSKIFNKGANLLSDWAKKV